MDYFSALRLQALAAIQKPDEAANRRYIYRWYSKTFHTPLHIVEELDPEDVYTAFYESTYEDMTDVERETEIRELLETPEEKAAKRRQKDLERAEMFEFAQYTAEEERRKEEKKRLTDLDVKQKQKFVVRETPETSLPKPKPATPMKDLKELPPNIEMKFVSDADFEALLDSPGNMIPGKGKG